MHGRVRLQYRRFLWTRLKGVRTVQATAAREIDVPGPEKRIPGLSNAEYERAGTDPNAQFLGTQSLHGGGDLTWIVRAAKAVSDWLKRRPH